MLFCGCRNVPIGMNDRTVRADIDAIFPIEREMFTAEVDAIPTTTENIPLLSKDAVVELAIDTTRLNIVLAVTPREVAEEIDAALATPRDMAESDTLASAMAFDVPLETLIVVADATDIVRKNARISATDADVDDAMMTAFPANLTITVVDTTLAETE